MLYCSWDMAWDRHNCCFSFWAIFCPNTLLTAQKIKISKKKKKWKKHLEMSSFYTCVLKVMIRWCTVPEIYGVWWMDGWKKWHIEVGAPPKELLICCWFFQSGCKLDWEENLFDVYVELIAFRIKILINISSI